MNNNLISNLVSELFQHIDSKKSFTYISDLLINSLGEYKKKFQIETYAQNKESSLNKIANNELINSRSILDSPEDEYLAISNDIHSILSNCSELTNTQKLDFCTNQRYFMKLYLKEVVINLNKA